LRRVEVPAHGYEWISFGPEEKGVWVRLRIQPGCRKVTAFFSYSNADRRPPHAHSKFDGLARPGDVRMSGGLIRARGANLRTLHLANLRTEGQSAVDEGYYELDGELKLRRVEDTQAHQWLKDNAAIPQGVLTQDQASVVFVDDQDRRWRLPKGDPALDNPGPLGLERIDREVATERDLFNCHGTFYELPAENAGGFAKIRPVATHNLRLKDYCSYRGMLVLSGIAKETPAVSPHMIRSPDRQAALWLGVVDDLWHLGKARGRGGPWNNTAVQAGQPSDPYLMTGYDQKSVGLSHDQDAPLHITLQVDLTGTGLWRPWKRYLVSPGEIVHDTFPSGFQAYWVRAVADADCHATVLFRYD